MFFNVLATAPRPNAERGVYLTKDSWNDFGFRTTFHVVVVDELGTHHPIGVVKIGEFNMGERRRPEIESTFDELDDRFFSLGQDDTYYLRLIELGDDWRNRILHGLRDFVSDEGLFAAARQEAVTDTSLLRSVSPKTVRGQFRRLLGGDTRLSAYAFSYQAPIGHQTLGTPLKLFFNVLPKTQPPTNIHVLVGRNGVGKTRLLSNMARSLVERSAPIEKYGAFILDESSKPIDLFAGLVSVTFSAFDPFLQPTKHRPREELRYSYVGLHDRDEDRTEDGDVLKAPTELAVEFWQSLIACRQDERSARWKRAIRMLEADPNFKEAGIANAIEVNNESQDHAVNIFEELSSGHKIVLLTMTRLVETVEEATLVLIDEPEAHLHPPLLAAFLRALSDLLLDRNGVAVIATHSPVVLQEVPKRCVWKMRRTGNIQIAERPEIETFGENVGTLTREIFGLEVTESGFHTMLQKAVDDGLTFEEVLKRFGDELGWEARSIVRGLVDVRDSERAQ